MEIVDAHASFCHDPERDRVVWDVVSIQSVAGAFGHRCRGGPDELRDGAKIVSQIGSDRVVPFG